MTDSIIVAIITASASIIVASLTFYLTKRHQWNVEWQHEKLNHYKTLLSALSDIATDGTDKNEAHKKFSLAANTIVLVAPQYVITALMKFQSEAQQSNPTRSSEKIQLLLNQLLLAIRKDIGISSKDDSDTFIFQLIGKSYNNKTISKR